VSSIGTLIANSNTFVPVLNAVCFLSVGESQAVSGRRI
jgi:hypothetical protein